MTTQLLADLIIIGFSCIAVHSFGYQKRFIMCSCISLGTMPIAFHAGVMWNMLTS